MKHGLLMMVHPYRWSWNNEPTLPYETTDVPSVQQAHDTLNPTQWIGFGLRNTRLIVTALNANGETFFMFIQC